MGGERTETHRNLEVSVSVIAFSTRHVLIGPVPSHFFSQPSSSVSQSSSSGLHTSQAANTQTAESHPFKYASSLTLQADVSDTQHVRGGGGRYITLLPPLLPVSLSSLLFKLFIPDSRRIIQRQTNFVPTFVRYYGFVLCLLRTVRCPRPRSLPPQPRPCKLQPRGPPLQQYLVVWRREDHRGKRQLGLF